MAAPPPASFSPEPGYTIHDIRGLAGSCFLLVNRARSEVVLIDSGLVGEKPAMERALAAEGLGWKDLKAVLLTHGHLDHTGNLSWIRKSTGAPIFAHPLEQAHIDGTFPYRGPSRVCGLMQRIGRTVLRYQPVRINEALIPGADLPFWGGLKVLHLPGHTEGHCGFYSQRFDLLFSGDLFASYRFSTHLPPMFLNSCAEKLGGSLRAVQHLAPRHLIPNHADRLNGELHRGRFDKLVSRLDTLG
jgi:glyoxylase-like metal-dependent hydrolase (beta-lactamase superfamily II)